MGALHHTLLVAPNLPATWRHARLRNVPLGGLRLDVEFTRRPGHLLVQGRSQRPAAFCLVPRGVLAEVACPEAQASERQIELPLPAVELELAHQLPLAGSATSQLKVVSERWTPKGLELEFEALAQSTYDLPVRLNRPNVRIRGAELTGDTLRVRFEGAAGYPLLSVSLTW